MTRAFVALAAFALTACGTVMHGSRDTIFVDSKPDGAVASISCAGNVEASGTTPAKLVIPRKVQGCSVSVERAGYKTQRLELEQSFSGAFWTNFVFSPVLATATIIEPMVPDEAETSAFNPVRPSVWKSPTRNAPLPLSPPTVAGVVNV